MKMIKRKVINVFRTIFTKVIKFVSFFIPKKKYIIYCFPEWITCLSNHVDIINYTADNVLSFINYLLRNYKGTKLTIYLFYFEFNRIDDYINYVNLLKNDKLQIHFILYDKNNLKSRLTRLFCFLKSKYIFTSNVLEQRFSCKLKKQIYISLNYYATGFKADTLDINYPNNRNISKLPVEYVISTSLLASQMLSIATNVPVEKFRTLGFARNDNIITPRFSKGQLTDMLNLPFKIDKIIIHTPTHRIGHNISTKKDVINYKNSFEDLCTILNKYNAILIIVPHPSEQLIMDAGKNDRIVLYKPNYQYTLYDILPHADALLTDYTTVYYDFLLTDRPVIFNFYDKNFYEKERGFAFDPIENICAGLIVKNVEELFNAIQQTLEGIDVHKQHRKFVTALIHKYIDSKSSERLLDFLNDKLKEK
jgi:hypothetical protein